MFVQLLVASQSLVTLSVLYYYYHLLVEIIFTTYHIYLTKIKNFVSQDVKNIITKNSDEYIEKIFNNNNKDNNNNCNLISVKLEKQLFVSGIIIINKKFNLVQCNLREKWPIVHTLVAYKNVDL